MFEEMTPIFTDKTLTPYDICELDGKNLKIFVGEDVVDGERTTVVLGSDIDSGVQYVLEVRKTEEKETVVTDGRELDMTDEEVFKIASGAETFPVHPFWLKDDITVGSVREAVLRFARAIEAEVKSKQCPQKPKPVKEWEPSFDLQQSFGLVVSQELLRPKGLLATEAHKWSKKRFWDKLKEEVDNHLKGGEE